MTPVEIAAWISDLAPSNEQRIKVLVDLIDNAGKDHMSAEDRGICVAELSRLESVQQRLTHRAQPDLTTFQQGESHAV